MIYGIMAIILILFAFLKKSYRTERLKQYPKQWFQFLYPMGLWCYDQYSKLLRTQKREEEKKANAVYIKENASDKLELDIVKRSIWAWFCLLFRSILATILAFQTDSIQQEQLKRPEFGETQIYHVTVDGIGEEESIDITVDGKQPNEEGMKTIFDEQFEQLKDSILGSNPSLDQISTDLQLPSSIEYGIRVSWESNRPEIMNDQGKIQTENIEEHGEAVELSIRMTYSTYESVYQLAIVVVPKIKDQAFYFDKLRTVIQRKNQEEAEEEYLNLPESIEEISLHYKIKTDKSDKEIFVLSIVAAAIVFLIGYQNLNNQYKKRNHQMQIDYPSVVSKLNLLIGAGMAPRMAWKKMITDYEKRKKQIRYAYEEMIITKNSIESGYPENRAYGEFGRRCGIHCYLKLGNLLEQNLKQGTSGLNQKLEEEMIHALEESKNMALRLGEEAGTKLLIPMFLMLGIVIVVLIVPAFMSFYV